MQRTLFATYTSESSKWEYILHGNFANFVGHTYTCTFQDPNAEKMKRKRKKSTLLIFRIRRNDPYSPTKVTPSLKATFASYPYPRGVPTPALASRANCKPQPKRTKSNAQRSNDRFNLSLLLFYRYAGPDSYQVTEKFNVDWGTYLVTNKSIIYAMIDGRGSGLMDNSMLFAGYRNLGTVEIADQINVTR